MKKRKARQAAHLAHVLPCQRAPAGAWPCACRSSPRWVRPWSSQAKDRSQNLWCMAAARAQEKRTGPLTHLGTTSQLSSRNVLWLAGHSHFTGDCSQSIQHKPYVERPNSWLDSAWEPVQESTLLMDSVKTLDCMPSVQ